MSIQGYTSDAIAQLKSTNYEDLVYARAQLPTETLIGMGYTVKEISILRAYKGEYIERGSEVYGFHIPDTPFIEIPSFENGL